MKKDDYKFLTILGDYSAISSDKAIKNLEKYESTGLTPQQVKDMQFLLMEKSRQVIELRAEVDRMRKEIA